MNLGIHMKNNNTIFSLIIFSILLSVATFTSAEVNQSGAEASSKGGTVLKLKAGHPEEYTVVKGDTLWDISGVFLDQPWYWPEIWEVNKQIKNPNLIYPGDVLTLVYVEGRPRIRRGKYGKRTVKLSPKTRAEDLAAAVPTIPLDAIAPYLSRNRILNAGEYDTLPYIVGVSDDRLSATAGEIIYVKGLAAEAGDTNFGLYNKGKPYKRANGTVLGYEAIFIGEAHLKTHGQPSTLIIDKSKAEVYAGYRVLPISKDLVIDANFLPKGSLVEREANIIGVLTNSMQQGVSMVGAMDVVVVDLGLEDGVETGDVFNIYKKGEVVDDPIEENTSVKLPDEINGNLMVFRPFNHMSYALVLDAQSFFRVGDVIKSPFAKENIRK